MNQVLLHSDKTVCSGGTECARMGHFWGNPVMVTAEPTVAPLPKRVVSQMLLDLASTISAMGNAMAQLPGHEDFKAGMDTAVVMIFGAREVIVASVNRDKEGTRQAIANCLTKIQAMADKR